MSSTCFKREREREIKSAMEDVESSSGGGARNNRRIIHRIWIEGYDTGFEHDDLKDLLYSHFASCGRVSHIHIPIAPGLFLNRFAFLYIQGEGAVENALQLSGSIVGGDGGGWIVMAKSFPFREYYSGPDLEAMHVAFPPPSHGQSASANLVVTGFDISLTKDVVFNAVEHYFSSCGRVNRVSYSGIPGFLHVSFCGGEAGFEKALKLSGRDFLGWNFVVDAVITPAKSRRISTQTLPTHSCLEVQKLIAAQTAQIGPMPPPSQSYLESREYQEIMARMRANAMMWNVPFPPPPY